MSDSILTTIKKPLGLDENYVVFDPDVIMLINTAFSTLHSLGIGPIDGFEITDETTTWDQFIGTDKTLNSVKTYIYLQVRLVFDPPTTSYLKDSIEKRIAELEWRLNVQRENVTHPEYVDLDDVADEVLVVDGGEI